MNVLLVRVGADLSLGGGSWNGPVDSQTGEFAYVAIPETRPVHPGMEKPYSELKPTLEKFGVGLPAHLRMQCMHLDPDFAHLTYGDTRQKADQLRTSLDPGDVIVFYAALADVHRAADLVYAIIGLLVVEELIPATNVQMKDRDTNAHSRRILVAGNNDLIVRGRPARSGRLRRCLPIGEYRSRAYRVRRSLLDEWGGLSVNDGYLQRSARFPRFISPERFLTWFNRNQQGLMQSNN
ncbi:MAG: hypothetical protein HY423_16230 [Candidatus Lambdaproteobacteria bacterium]|nr:hypothetical protein [Candidatus Lambdaproteobacteria bacterium]